MSMNSRFESVPETTLSEDEIFADLSPALRKKVMREWSGQPDIESSSPIHTPFRPSLSVASVAVGVPLMVIGMLLTMTVLFAPIGIPLMVLSCIPAKRALGRTSKVAE